MIQIALCDDDRAHLAKVETLLNEYFTEHPDIHIRIKSFTSAANLLEYI